MERLGSEQRSSKAAVKQLYCTASGLVQSAVELSSSKAESNAVKQQVKQL